jgi:hypothetical protein
MPAGRPADSPFITGITHSDTKMPFLDNSKTQKWKDLTVTYGMTVAIFLALLSGACGLLTQCVVKVPTTIDGTLLLEHGFVDKADSPTLRITCALFAIASLSVGALTVYLGKKET